MSKKSRRAKACDITPATKRKVFARDGGCCIFCGNSYNVMPNAHFIPRSDGGLGIPENILTACTRLMEGDCHHKFDEGPEEVGRKCGSKPGHT
ncbi:MAG: hypothetical protein VB049_08350 [Candidatus Pelethousia sp.]|nr:hypothetical protein [Candidatus Pelethousia sp.]